MFRSKKKKNVKTKSPPGQQAPPTLENPVKAQMAQNLQQTTTTDKTTLAREEPLFDLEQESQRAVEQAQIATTAGQEEEGSIAENVSVLVRAGTTGEMGIKEQEREPSIASSAYSRESETISQSMFQEANIFTKAGEFLAKPGVASSWMSSWSRKPSETMAKPTTEVELAERKAETDYNLMNENEEIPTKVPSAAWGALMRNPFAGLSFKKEPAAAFQNSDGLEAPYVASDQAGMQSNDKAIEIETKANSYDGLPGRMRYLLGTLCTGWVLYGLLFTAMAGGLAYGALNDGNFLDFVDWELDLNVAFIGNSYLFVNDIPRLVETMSQGHLTQNSVLHSGGSLGALLVTGNGMYPRWKTSEALEVSQSDAYSYSTTYDYGLCTVRQILAGYDANITYGNSNGAYFNDGHNPCFVEQNYMEIAEQWLNESSTDYDFVVLVDQTKRMAVESARQDTISALQVYAALIESSGAVPVIIDTHSFYSDSTNMTGLGDIPTFQKLINDGVDEYVSALSSMLPRRQYPRVCPIGLAYLTIWEERPDTWSYLFLDDSVHASLHGSYLFATVLYTTMFGHLPPEESSLPEPMDALFTDLRKVFYGSSQYPSYEEAQYYRNVAKRVVIHKYKPKSLR